MNLESAPDASASIERRQFRRKKFRGKLEIEWGSETLIGTVSDLAPRGLFVELTPPLWVRATFRARLILNPILQLDRTVCRVEPGRGIGVTFDLPEESGKAQFEALLATLRQL